MASTRGAMKQVFVSCRVQPGLQPSERVVGISLGDKVREFIVSNSLVSGDDSVRVWVVSEKAGSLWVEVPGEPLSSGMRIEVPRALVRHAA